MPYLRKCRSLSSLFIGLICGIVAHAQPVAHPSASAALGSARIVSAEDTSGVRAKPDSVLIRETQGPLVAERPMVTGAAASGIIFTCDSAINAIPGVCDTLNSKIAGLYSRAFLNVNANIYVTLGNTGLGSSEFYYTLVSYTSFRTALAQHITSASDKTAFENSVPAVNPITGTTAVAVSSPLARVLGITQFGIRSEGTDCTPGLAGCYDGIITISNSLQTAGRLYFRTGPIGANQYDFYSVIEHETDEILGTTSCAFSCGSKDFFTPADLFRYHSDGTRSFTPGTNAPCSSPSSSNACFSLDGIHMLQQYNNITDGTDKGDWVTNCANSLVQDAVGCPGVADVDISPLAEILVLDVVGYDVPLTTVLTKTISDTNSSGGGCSAPAPVSSFMTSSVRAWLYFSVTDAATGDSAQIQFVRPNGTVHSTTTIAAGGTGLQCFSASLAIKDATAASFPGIWTARALWNGSPVPLFALTFTIGAAGCTFSLDSSGAVFGSAGGTGTLQIAAPANCFWLITDAPDWVTFQDAGGGGDSSATYRVFGNPGPARTALLNIAGSIFTIEQQAASIPGLTYVGSMPHLAAQDVWTTTFTLVNKSNTPATARLNLFGDPSGGLTLPLLFPQTTSSKPPLLASSLDRAIPAQASLVIASGGPQTGPVQVGSAQLSATGAIDGFAIFHLIPGAQEAVVPLEIRNANSYVLAFDNTGGVVLGVAVQNIAAAFTTIPVVIRDDTGAVISAPGTTFSLAASGHTSFVLSQQYPFTANKRGTIEFTRPANGRISVLGIRTTPLITPNGTNTLTLTTIPALANVGASGGSIAHIATGGGWQTTFVLVNTGTAAAQATLNFFATGTGAPLSIPLAFPQTGSSSNANTVTQSLAAGASLIVQSAGPATDPTATIGSAQLTTNGNVGGFVIFRYNPNGQEAVVPLESRNSTGGFVIAFDNTAGTATGIALNSASAQATNVTATVRDDTGNPLAADTLPLAANGHMAFTLGVDRFTVAAGKRGTIEFVTSSGGQIGVLGIRIPPTLTFTTLPALAK